MRVDSYDESAVGMSSKVVDCEVQPLKHVFERMTLVVKLHIPEDVRQKTECGQRRVESESIDEVVSLLFVGSERCLGRDPSPISFSTPPLCKEL